MMMGNGSFNSGASPQLVSGFMDPFAMQELRDSMSEYTQSNPR